MRYQLLSTALLNAVSVSTTRIKLVVGSDDGINDTPLPVVIWHGLGDAYNAEGIQSVGVLIEDINPGTLVHYVQIGTDGNADRSASFLGNVTAQIETVCDTLATHPILSTAPAIDAIGFSQGGAFLRGYVERCNNPPIRSLVTFGSPHAGISRFHDCGATDFLCKGAMALLKFNTWSNFVQSRLVPAQYYRDLEEYDDYLASSAFLADINNERHEKKDSYKENLASLTNIALYQFEDDTVLIPKESAWFGELNGTETIPLQSGKLYEEDWLGLRELDSKGALHLRTVPGEHMHLNDKDLTKAVKDFFGPYKRKFSHKNDFTVSEL